MAKNEPRGRVYPFTRQFEVAVAYATAHLPRFYDLIGHALLADRMPSEDAVLLVRCAHAAAKKSGGVCPSSVFALQEVRNLVDGGKLTHEDFKGAERLVTLAEDIGIDDLDALVSMVTPIVRKDAHQDAIDKTVSDFARGAPPEEVAERFERIATMGRQRTSLGSGLEGTVDDIMAAVAPVLGQRLPTGVTELDILLNGGLERKALGCVMGGTGGGKSLFLCSIAAEALLCGIDVAYMTLEISEAEVKKRIYCNLTNMTADELSKTPEECSRRMGMLAQHYQLGRLRVRYETPYVTTPQHMRLWLRDLGQQQAVYPRVIIADYADKLVSKVGSEKRSYEEMRIVYDALRSMAVERDGWSWTASQIKSGSDGKKRLGVDDGSDSAEKSRIADLVVALPRTDDDKDNALIRFRVPKRRIEEAHGEAGPMPMDAEHGRIAVISRDEPW